jgi:iron complex outermembrane receptor protein
MKSVSVLNWNKSLFTLACLGSTCLSSLAFAQAAAQTAQAPAVDEIVVTGTRVVRDGYEAPTPVSVIGIENLQNIATSNLADSINQLPTLVGSSTPSTTATTTTTGTSAINGLNLRGLGTTRTLVLLNGQRTVGSILTGVVDVSELPQSLIERVDVVTGGASAAYGSDALSGVVNFVLDTDFTGFKSEVSGGITTYGDAPNYKINMTYGTPFAGGRGHFLLTGEHVWDDGLIVIDRPWNKEGHSYINNPAYTATNGQPRLLQVKQVGLSPIIAWGGALNVPNTHPLYGTAFGPGGVQYRIAPGDIVDGPIMRGGSWEAQQVAPVRGAALVPQQNRQDVFTRASYDVSDTLTVYGHAAWGHLGSYSSGAPNFFPGNLALRTDNAFLPANLRAALEPAGVTTGFNFGTMNMDLDNFRAVYDRRVLRFLVGAEGSFEMGAKDWNWDMYLSNGEAFGSLKSIGAIDQPRYRQAVDAVRNPATGAIVCRSTLTNPGDGCVPLNVFGIGVASPAAIDYVQGRYGWNNQRLNQKVAAVNFNGNPFETWAGDVSLAVGYEFRKETMRQISDPEEQALPTIWFQGAGQPYTGAVTVNDIYAETVVPLAKDAEWASALDVNAAVRATHYSTYGWVATWKVGATYAPVDDLRLRATRSRNIRSPTLVDLYQAGTSQNNAVNDPFTNSTVNYTSRASGNPNLVAEKSNDLGLGVVYQPSWLEGFSASVDYYRINIKDAVNQPSPSEVLNLCFAGNQTACAAVTRTTQNGAPFLFIQQQPQNFASEKARGIDFEASYRTPLSALFDSADGDISLRMLATRYLKYEINNGTIGSIIVDYAGTNGPGGNSVPKWRLQSVLGYNLDPVNFGLTFRYISSGKNVATQIECTSGCPTSTAQNLTADNNTIRAAYYLDLNLAYKMEVGEAASSELFFNVRNLFNRDPEIAARGPGGTSYDFPPTSVGLYDTLGRVFRAGVRFKM